MNLLHVVHYPVFGGPHNELLRLHQHLRQQGWKVIALLPDEPGNAASRLQAGGVEVITLPLARLRKSLDPIVHARLAFGLAPQVQAIRLLLRRAHIDLVEIGGLANPHAAIAARLESVPVVWQIVDSRTPRIVRSAMMPLVRGIADAVLFAGESLIPMHCGRRPLAAPSFVYSPPVDTQAFRPNLAVRQEVRLELAIPDDAPVVGTVANLNPQKGIEYFVRAAVGIYARQPECRFLLVGAEHASHRDYAASIRAEIARSGVPADRFVLTGGRNDVERLYPAMDVKLITSVPRSEGVPTTALEAMACGVPVVATDVGAVSEVVEDGVTGFVVPPLDPTAIAEASLGLLADAELRRRFGETARDRAITRYDVRICAEGRVRAFRAAIEHHRARSAATTRVASAG